MLLDLEVLARKYRMKVTGVLHAGAHLAEEAEVYSRLFPGAPVWWVEANADVIPKIKQRLRRFPNQQVFEALLWAEPDIEMPFNVTNHDGMSSSILEFGTHPEFSPETVFVDHRTLTTTTIDRLVYDEKIRANLLNMDLQGVEWAVAKGGRDFIDDQVDYINSEVNIAEVYKGCTQMNELDAFFTDMEFRLVETSIVPGQGWGDALWIRP